MRELSGGAARDRELLVEQGLGLEPADLGQVANHDEATTRGRPRQLRDPQAENALFPVGALVIQFEGGLRVGLRTLLEFGKVEEFVDRSPLQTAPRKTQGLRDARVREGNPAGIVRDDQTAVDVLDHQPVEILKRGHLARRRVKTLARPLESLGEELTEGGNRKGRKRHARRAHAEDPESLPARSTRPLRRE